MVHFKQCDFIFLCGKAISQLNINLFTEVCQVVYDYKYLSSIMIIDFRINVRELTSHGFKHVRKSPREHQTHGTVKFQL